MARILASLVSVSLLLCTPTLAQAQNTTTPTKFGIILFPAFEPIDVFGPAEVLQMLSRSTHLDLYLISSSTSPSTLDPVSTAPRSPSMNPFNSTFFQSVVPTHTLATAPADVDVLLVPGGLGTRAHDLGQTVAYIARAFPRVHSLISVCTGALLVAQTGLLDGKRATTNKVAWGSVTPLYPAVRWDRSARWAVDGKIWSSGGVSAGIDVVTLAWVAEVYGEAAARDTANRIEYEWRNDPSWDVFGYVW